MTPDEVEGRLALAERAFRANRQQPLERRSQQLLALGALLRRERESLAQRMTREMGKPLGEAQAEVDKCVTGCEYFAHQGPSFLADQPTPSDSPRSLVAFRPLGVVLAIMPWNYPLWQVIRFLAPALMAGNSALLKHAPNCFGSALALGALVDEAGFPEGSLGVILTGTEPIEGLIADRRIRAVTLTGSDRAGSQVAQAAGRAVKKTVMELGGSDFFLVFPDADLERAAQVGVASRFQNCGQSCIAAKRFLLAEEIAQPFLERFLELVQGLKVGDPLEADTRLGPLAREDLRQTLHQQVQRTVQAGAQRTLGGEVDTGRGYFYSPTVLLGVRPGMPAFDEETFGPVAAVTTFRGEEEGLRLANHERYGLGGNLWTGDEERGLRLARELDTGGVFINGMTHSDPRAPFGGVKRSGYGRELHHFGIREFANIQTVWRP